MPGVVHRSCGWRHVVLLCSFAGRGPDGILFRSRNKKQCEIVAIASHQRTNVTENKLTVVYAVVHNKNRALRYLVQNSLRIEQIEALEA